MYLYGASGHARVITDILAANGVPVDALVDDNARLAELDGIPVAHDATGLSPMIVSIGNNRIRRQIAAGLCCAFATAVHPRATVSPSASVGEGTVVMAGATVNAAARVGRHCIINTNASVDMSVSSAISCIFPQTWPCAATCMWAKARISALGQA